MRAREDAVKRLGALALLVVAAPSLAGCGAVFHTSQTITITTRPEDKAVVYAAGTPLVSPKPGTYETKVFLNTHLGGELVAVGTGKKPKPIRLTRHVDAAAIVCDVLWTLTIVGVAAPISDALLGTFVKTESDVDVALEPEGARTANPMPTYAVYGATVPASTSDAPIVSPAATQAPPPPSPEPPAPPAPSGSAPPSKPGKRP